MRGRTHRLSGPRPASDRIAQLSLDPAYRQLTADREMARLRIRDLQRGEGDLRRQIGSYQARVESAPRVEQQLSSVQRDYDLERQQYSELSSKLHTATIAENVERDGAANSSPCSTPQRCRVSRPSRCHGA